MTSNNNNNIISESTDPNIQFMLAEYKRLVAEQADTIKKGYRLNDYCWNCKKYYKKLKYKICDNGYISYWCTNCY